MLVGDPAVVLYCMPDDASRCVSLQLHDAVNLTMCSSIYNL